MSKLPSCLSAESTVKLTWREEELMRLSKQMREMVLVAQAGRNFDKKDLADWLETWATVVDIIVADKAVPACGGEEVKPKDQPLKG